MAHTTIQQQSFEIARQEIPGWVPVGISEKKHDLSWGEQGRCLLVALRKPEHAHLPFPGDLAVTGDLPCRAICFLWQGSDNYAMRDTARLFEFSNNSQDPTVNEIMQRLRNAIG